MPSGSQQPNDTYWMRPQFRALVESVNAAIFIIQGTKYIYANPKAEAMWGYCMKELRNMEFWGIVHPEEQDAVRMRGLARQHGVDHGEDIPSSYPIRIIHSNGAVRHTSYTASVIEVDGAPAILGVSQDVTDTEERRLQMEEQFRQAQKMEAIGTLVGGIAHDFNNILAGITGNVYLARMFAGDEKKIGAKLDRIEHLSFRAAAMIRQLLAFARKDMVCMQAIDVATFVSEIMARERMEISRHIEIAVDIGAAGDLWVQGDTTQLQQVLLNLLANSCAALEGVSEPLIRLSVSPFAADAAFMQTHSHLGGPDLVRISVIDNGCGMSEEVMHRIFEPFFSTRDVGSGSGLGLSMVYGAVQMHGGALEVESQPGKGSRFHLFLPRYQAESRPVAVMPESGMERGRDECILYVDDDPGVLSIGCEVLRSLGYKVLPAINGCMAVDLFTEHVDEIDLVLLDVVMPVQDGRQAAARILDLRPDMKIIFATGYDRACDRAETVDEKGQGMGGDVLIKPYSISMLSHMIRLKLDNG